MPNLADRAHRIPASPIRKLVGYAEDAKAKGIEVFHLNIGQPDLPTPPVFFEALKAHAPSVLSYSHSAGLPALRKAIQQYYARKGHGLSTEDIIVTTGASEALNFLSGSIINPGDEIIIPEPFYANYVSLFIAAGANVVPIPTSIHEDFALPSPEAFERAISPKTKAILVCNPGNPTGIQYPESALRNLGELAKKHDLFLVADEVYREFVYGEVPHFSVLDLPDISENVILVDSISKRFSACGARIGCIISRNERVKEAILKLAQIRLASPTLDQLGAISLYQLPESYFKGVVSEYKGRRDLLLQRLQQMEGVYAPNIAGAFYAMVELPIDDAETFCKWLLTDFSYNSSTLMLAPGSGFYKQATSGRNQVRIAYVLQEEKLSFAMDCLEKGLEVYSANYKSPKISPHTQVLR
ncbi:MAG: pyridoxal phosphate-dependent aminotransferase [Bacteroidota bacterium]